MQDSNDNIISQASIRIHQRKDGGFPRQITSFKSHRIRTFAYSPDGRQLAFARGSHTSGAVLISE